MILPITLLGLAATTLAQLRTPGTIEFATGEQLATILDPNFHGVNIVVNTPSDVYAAAYTACVAAELASNTIGDVLGGLGVDAPTSSNLAVFSTFFPHFFVVEN